MAALGDYLNTAQKQVAVHAAKLDGLNKVEANIAFIALEVAAVGELRADVTILKDWTSWIYSLIVPQCPPLFEEFHEKRWALLWLGNCDLRCDTRDVRFCSFWT
jgi:hypothetical protein